MSFPDKGNSGRIEYLDKYVGIGVCVLKGCKSSISGCENTVCLKLLFQEALKMRLSLK
jgi:hypothetical protein